MIISIIIIIILTLVNAFFAMSEIAFISLNDAKINKMAEEGNKKAKKVMNLLKDPSKFLATIQIGITLGGFLASAFAADAFSSRLTPYLSFIPISAEILQKISLVIITIILSYFTLVFGELVPKKIAMKYYEKISFAVVGILNGIYKVTKPFVWLLSASTNLITKMFGIKEAEENPVTEEEIKLMIDIGEEKGTIEQQEKLFINNVFEFNDKTAEEIMIPRVDVLAIDVYTTMEEAIDIVNKNSFSRLPVYEDNVDNILGILHVRDLLANEKNNVEIRAVLRPCVFVPGNKKINKILSELKKKKQSMAIVVDEYGGTAGIVTIEDIVEEIVGEISDEFDIEELDYQKIDENTYIVDGGMRIYEIERLFDTEVDDADNETISGLLLAKIGDFPQNENDLNLEIANLSFSIIEYDDKKINKIKICKNK